MFDSLINPRNKAEDNQTDIVQGVVSSIYPISVYVDRFTGYEVNEEQVLVASWIDDLREGDPVIMIKNFNSTMFFLIDVMPILKKEDE